MRRGPPQLGVLLVLPTGAGWRGAGPLDFLKSRYGRFHESDLLRKVFETTVQRCKEVGVKRCRTQAGEALGMTLRAI